MAIPVIGLGAGGHARVVIEILQHNPKYEVVCLLDTNSELHGKEVSGIPILGNDTLLPKLVEQGIRHCFIGLGSVGNATPRKKLYHLALSHNLEPVNSIHPTALISPSAQTGLGLTAAAYSVINAGVIIGENVIINTGAIVEHDCTIGSHAHIATGARLASNVQVGDGAHIGIGVSIRQCIVIGEGAIVGAGAVVVKDVPAASTVVGTPAKPLRP